MVMDLTIKIIPVFFVLILAANYFNFLGFWLIMRIVPAFKGRSLRKRTTAYFLIMNIMYVAVVVLAFVPPFQPLCSPQKAYPYVMSWASLLFIINFIFQWSINCRQEWFLQPIEE